jgi:hypothetical protein
MWVQRDMLVDDVIAGRLPGDHDAVRQLIRNMDMTLRVGLNVTLSDVLIFRFQLGKLDPSAWRIVMKEAEPCRLDGLTEAQRTRMNEYSEKFGLLLVGLLILGSWFGMICVVGYFLVIAARRIAEQLRNPVSLDKAVEKLEHMIVSTARQATDTVAGSPLGHRVSETLPVLPRDYAPMHDSTEHHKLPSFHLHRVHN